jgi:hypothetical protein
MCSQINDHCYHWASSLAVASESASGSRRACLKRCLRASSGRLGRSPQRLGYVGKAGEEPRQSWSTDRGPREFASHAPESVASRTARTLYVVIILEVKGRT